MGRLLTFTVRRTAPGVSPAENTKPPTGGGFEREARDAYMRAIMASPKAEQDSSLAPSMRRAKS